ncbi:hypothetical protein [Algivirga pacifica]|uniref:DUF2004 domain-containing protein n=1 Tax=Algivirga pacifica TaxID=1162670 RepID=A0ABP9D9H8_9BACT
MSNYFSEQEVSTLKSLEGTPIEHVIYHVWTNVAQKGELFESLDWLELRFPNQERIFLSGGMESDSIKLVDFDLRTEKEAIEKQFSGQVEIRSYIVNEMELWKPAVNKPIREIRLSGAGGHFLNDEFIITVDSEEEDEEFYHLMISLSSEEGLLVELHEDI